MSRYNRHIQLDEIGQRGQQKLSEAKVLIIGAGGLGCPVLQYLTAAGIGTIGIMDFDIVEESNLQNKCVLLIIDGLGDLPIPELKGKTPLEAAKTPVLDQIC